MADVIKEVSSTNLNLNLSYLNILDHSQLASYSFNVIVCMSSNKLYIKFVYLSAIQSFGPNNQVYILANNLVKKPHPLIIMPCNLSSREQLARAIRELEIEDLMELEFDSDREEDILLLHDLYTKRYLVPQSSIKLLKTYSPEDLLQLSPSNFKQLTRTTHIAFGKLCDLLRGDSIFYNYSRHKQIAMEIQVAVGLSQLGSNGNEASIGKIQMIFG
ncbi:hypothetical protein BY996DRAFT_6472669 [Phakopsora pachyrhizi]|nr:hypothetical protein BY996DRAFT_6472669 [Phakopsora pachyrhizi]